MKVKIRIYGFITGIPLNILIIYGKDPNFKENMKLNYFDCSI